MSMDLEKTIKRALADLDSFRTDACLDTETIVRYTEGDLSAAEKDQLELHLRSCLYCLKQLNDMAALRHFDRQAKLTGQVVERQGAARWEKFREFFRFSANPWRFTSLGLATALAALLVSSFALRTPRVSAPRLDPASFPTISAYDTSGKLVGQQRGTFVSDDGCIEGDLRQLSGASTIKVTLRNGKTVEVKEVWKDDDLALAVMKIDGNDSHPIPMADISNISIGQRIFAVPDDEPEGGTAEVALVSDVKSLPGRREMDATRLIQVAVQKSTKKTSKLVDDKGNLIGYVIDNERNIKLAAPAGSFRNIIKSTRPQPVAALSKTSWSTNAFNEYLKGVMANDLHRWDEAIHHLQSAIKLNPKLTGAYDQLGYAYYQKNDFIKEATAYGESLKLNLDNPDSLYNLAWNRQTLGKYHEAIPLYEKALQLTPDDKETLYQLGLSYLAQGDTGKARVMARRLEPLDPGQAGLLRRLIK